MDFCVPNDAINSANGNCKKHDYNNGTRYLYVGSLIKRKHLDVVIRAFISIAKDAGDFRKLVI